MGLGRLVGSQRFRAISNVVRLSILPSLIAIAASEVWTKPIIQKTGSTMYLLTGTMTVLVGMLILSVIDSKEENEGIYISGFLQGLVNALESAIRKVCEILKYPAYLMVALGGISTPIFAVFAKRDEFQEMPVAIIPDGTVNLIFFNILSIIAIALITSGFQFPIYRSYRVLKSFDEFMRAKGDSSFVEYQPILGDWVPTLTFYLLRILRNLSTLIFNTLVLINRVIPLKKILYIFRPLIWFSEWMVFATSWSVWAMHQLLILILRWSASLATFALYFGLLYFNSKNLISHITSMDLGTAIQFAAMFLLTFYTFATAYLFHDDMKEFARASLKEALL